MTPFKLGPMWWFLAVGSVIGVLVMVFGSLRTGGYVLAGFLIVTAMGRAVLPGSAAGGVAIRSRWVDVLFLLIAAAAVIGIFAAVRLTPAY